MQLNASLFSLNAACGYVLKPDVRHPPPVPLPGQQLPSWPPENLEPPTRLRLVVLSGARSTSLFSVRARVAPSHRLLLPSTRFNHASRWPLNCAHLPFRSRCAYQVNTFRSATATVVYERSGIGITQRQNLNTASPSRMRRSLMVTLSRLPWRCAAKATACRRLPSERYRTYMTFRPLLSAAQVRLYGGLMTSPDGGEQLHKMTSVGEGHWRRAEPTFQQTSDEVICTPPATPAGILHADVVIFGGSVFF